MSKFTNNNIAANQSVFVHYNLINMALYAANVKTKSSNEGNYQIMYTSDSKCGASSNTFNVVYHNPRDNLNIHNYCATNIYFYKLYHNNVTDITDDKGLKGLIGELIIENVDATNGDKFFLCFLIQSVTTGGTDDTDTAIVGGKAQKGSLTEIYNNIIKDSDGNFYYSGNENDKGAIKVSPSADGTIPGQNMTGCIIYYDEYKNAKSETINAYVMINLNPITVSNSNVISFLNSLSQSSTTPPFSKYPSGGEKDILTSTMLSNLTKTLGLDTITSNPALAGLFGGGAAAGKGSHTDASQVDNDIYIDCKPTGVSEEEIATYNIPINSGLSNDMQNSSFIHLCSNFALFALILVAAYIGIPGLYRVLVRKYNGAEHYYVQILFVGYFCALFAGLLGEGFSKGNMKEISAGIVMVVLAVLSYVLISFELIGLKTEKKNIDIGSFNLRGLGEFFIDCIIFLITDAYILILACWIVLVVTLVILKFVYDRDSKKILDYGLWIGLAGIPPAAGIFTYVSQ